MLTCVDCGSVLPETGQEEIKCKNCGSYTEINRRTHIRILAAYDRGVARQILKRIISYRFEEGMRNFNRRLTLERLQQKINESKYS